MEKYERLLARAAAAARAVRLAFVIQRYGLEVNGGAELHCRLAGRAAGAAAPGRGVRDPRPRLPRVEEPLPEGHRGGERHPRPPLTVQRTRNARVFASLSNLCFHETHTREEEEAWVRENGPFSPDLVKAVAAARDRFDRFLFYCYRYYHSYHGLPAVARPRDPRAHGRGGPGRSTSGSSSRFFHAPARHRLPDARRSRRSSRTRAATARCRASSSAAASTCPRPDPALDFRAKHGLDAAVRPLRRPHRPEQGRVTLFAYFRKFLEETGPDVDLVLAGKSVVPIPDAPAHPPRRLHHARRRRWRRCGSAGCS